jgi:phenylacetic acid degradation operon negative regulatory protein
MKPRELVFDLFGDYLRYLGGEARLQDVVRLLADFGVPESTSRVVMTRMRKQGWLGARREGRGTVYSLSERSWELLDEGRGRIFERETKPWDRKWRVVVYSVPEADRGARDRVRKQLRWLGFGALGSSTWISPHDRLQDVRRALADEPSVRSDLLVASSEGPAADLDMARRSWDLDGLNRTLVEARDAYRSRLAKVRALPPTGADALVERVSLIHGYRHTLFQDPDLPHELLPTGWVGGEAHQLFLELHELLRPEAESYCRSVVGVNPATTVS